MPARDYSSQIIYFVHETARSALDRSIRDCCDFVWLQMCEHAALVSLCLVDKTSWHSHYGLT
jgi:hypothetical protein